MRSNTVTASQDKESRRVIAAEDEALTRLDVMETLTEHGFEAVGEAVDGEEAVKLVLELEPDSMAIDVRVPRLDRISAADKIMKGVPCAMVMLTAFSDKELIGRAKDAGMMAYLVKPFQAKDLILAVEVALSCHQEMLTLEDSIVDLQDRLTTRKQVDHAKGLLMEKMDLSEPEVFRWIQKTSMDRRSPMCEVADAVIEQLGSA